MTIAELIVELKKLDQTIPVCGQSETCTWEIEARELVPIKNVWVDAGAYGAGVYSRALILGYKH